jgi:uncharacterized membrane protein
MYWAAMVSRLWTFGISIGSVVAASWIQRRRLGTTAGRLRIESDNDIPEAVRPGLVAQCLYWACVVFVFAFLYLEVGAMMRLCPVFRLPVLSAMWCAMALYFLWRFAVDGCRSGLLFGAMVLATTVALMKLLAMDLAAWCYCERGYYDIEYRFGDAAARLLDFGSIAALLCFVWWWIRSTGRKALQPALFGWAALALVFAYATLELNSLLHWRLPVFERGGLSVLWALFAFAFIGSGIWRNMKSLRYLGLGLFAVVVAKVFLADLEGTPMIYRVVAFIAVGIALLMGSFAYIHSNRKFEIRTDEEGS